MSDLPHKDAIADYNKANAHECLQGQICRPQFNRIGWDLARLGKRFPKRTVAELTVPALVEFLETFRTSRKTYNNRRGVLSTFFKYAFHCGWLAENPIPKAPHYRNRRTRWSAVTLSAPQAAELMAYGATGGGSAEQSILVLSGPRLIKPHTEPSFSSDCVYTHRT